MISKFDHWSLQRTKFFIWPNKVFLKQGGGDKIREAGGIWWLFKLIFLRTKVVNKLQGGTLDQKV